MNKFLKGAALFTIISTASASCINVYGAEANTKLKETTSVENNEKPKIGFVVNSDNSKSLIDGKGNYVTSSWCMVGGKWYYFDENKKMKIGWANSDNKWYYLNNDGTMKNGWLCLSGVYYYLNEAGELQTGWFKDTNNDYYYYSNDNGEMLTGWQEINYKWYYFDESGHMVHDTYIGNYKLGSDGAML